MRRWIRVLRIVPLLFILISSVRAFSLASSPHLSQKGWIPPPGYTPIPVAKVWTVVFVLSQVPVEVLEKELRQHSPRKAPPFT